MATLLLKDYTFNDIPVVYARGVAGTEYVLTSCDNGDGTDTWMVSYTVYDTYKESYNGKEQNHVKYYTYLYEVVQAHPEFSSVAELVEVLFGIESTEISTRL